MASSYETNGNLDNLPDNFSASDSDSDEDDSDDAPDDDDDDDGKDPQGTADTKPADSRSDSGGIWAGATEAQRREFERLEHADRSQRGRVSALTRQVDDLRRQLEQEASKQKAPAASTAQADDVDDSTMKQFSEDYPEIAQAMNAIQSKNDKLIQKLESQLQGVSTVVSPIAQREAEQAKQGEWNRLLEAHPDAEAISSDPKFHEWATGHHLQEIRLMYGSDYADSNINLLRIYKEENNIPSAKPGNRQRQVEADDSDDRLSDMEGLGGGRGGPRRGASSRGDSDDDLFDTLAKRHAETGRI